MRYRLYGCSWASGVRAYSAQQGSQGESIDGRDLAYDGVEEAGALSGGLGRLVDGDTR